MNKKVLKAFCIVDAIVLLVSYIYFFLDYFSIFLLQMSEIFNSHKLLNTYYMLRDALGFGMSDEGTVFITVMFFLAIFITSVFSAIFYYKTVSRTTYILLVLGTLPVALPYLLLFLAYLFVEKDIALCDPLSVVCHTIAFVVIIIYAVFTGIFMCRDFKTIAVKNK